MLRIALVSLLVVGILSGALQAQRAGASFHGNAVGLGLRSGFLGQRGFPNGFLPRGSGLPRGGFFPITGSSPRRRPSRPYRDVGSAFFPYFWPFEEEESYPEAETTEPLPPAVLLRAPDTPLAKPHLIEIPVAANSAAAKVLPPAIFILANGERLEARRFLLTARNLSVRVDRQERTVPVAMLDIDATIAANRERGIDLRIPSDQNEISVGF